MNDCKSLVVSRKISKGDKYFPVDVVRAMERVAESARDRAYLLYHIQTGLRVSDVVATRIEHIDWKEFRTYTFDHKKDSWRWVYWAASLKGPLKMWLKERLARKDLESREQKQLLFPFSEKTANRIIKGLATSAGFRYSSLVSSHWCRHTFIKLSRAAGRDIKAVQQNTGDTIRTLLDWYSNFSKDEMRREIDNKPILGGGFE